MAAFKLPRVKKAPRKELQGLHIPEFHCDKLSIHRRLAQGTFGDVYTTFYNTPGGKKDEVVIKKMLHVMDHVERRQFYKEVAILSKLSHENVVRLKGISHKPCAIMMEYIFFDFGPFGEDLHVSSLSDLLLQIDETECKNFTRQRGIPVTLDLDGELQDLSKDISLCIYRILQEGLRNIARHAKATDIQVILSKEDDALNFMVKDNGKGFDPASNKKSSGLGMASMAERARLIQGDLYIESRPGEGTAIRLEAPYASRE